MRGIEENTLLSEKLEERLKACEAEITQAEKDAVTEKSRKNCVKSGRLWRRRKRSMKK